MSETSKIAHHAHSLELAAAGFRKLNKPAMADSCANAASYLRSLIPISRVSDPSRQQAVRLMSAIEDIAAERRRQIEAEGWTLEHDDKHSHGEMALAAAAYAYESDCAETDGADLVTRPHWWPWSDEWWKPKNRRNMLIKAGALIVAEIERLDRLPKPSVED